VISKGAAQSWQMENRGHTMADGEFDFGFAVEWMVKDLAYVAEEAKRNGSDIPVTETVLGFYQELAQTGSARKDTSSLITRLR
jgi:3-hydroxyisobutyrate dehydrogenase-like beta-hydroxyacid dehydrogenase